MGLHQVAESGKMEKNAEAKSKEFTISDVAKLYMNIYDNGVDSDDENKKK